MFINIPSLLKEKWNNFVRHLLAVLVPVLPVLLCTSLVITHGTVSEQNHEEDEVEVGHWAGKQSRQGPEESSEKLGDIMKMSRDPPPSRNKEQTLSLLSLTGVISGTNQIRSLAPYCTVPISISCKFPLPISIIVEKDADHS